MVFSPKMWYDTVNYTLAPIPERMFRKHIFAEIVAIGNFHAKTFQKIDISKKEKGHL